MAGHGGSALCSAGPAGASLVADLFCWRGGAAPARPLTSLVRLRAAWGASDQASACQSRGASVPARQVRPRLLGGWFGVPALRAAS